MTVSLQDLYRMKAEIKKISLFSTGVLIFGAVSVMASVLEVSNPLPVARKGEIVEVAVQAFGELPGSFRLKDQKGKEVAYQLTYDGKLIFPATVDSLSTSIYYLEVGCPSKNFPVYVYGRQFPERKDDMAWENDRSAYRAYGPALQKSGEPAYGYDIWSKSVPYPVLEQRFFDDRERKISFHVDHGNGLDGYAVGPTLGGGTAALLDSSGKILYPYCYRDCEILDNGPLRFTFRLVYNPVVVDGREVTETRVISLDLGSWLNRTKLRYDGLEKKTRLAQGIVVHSDNPDGYTISKDGSYVAYQDLTDNPDAGNGEIYVGVISPDSHVFLFMSDGRDVKGVEGHVAAVAEYVPGSEFTYWWGSGWSKGGIRDSCDWNSILYDMSARMRHPLSVKVK